MSIKKKNPSTVRCLKTSDIIVMYVLSVIVGVPYVKEYKCIMNEMYCMKIII